MDNGHWHRRLSRRRVMQSAGIGAAGLTATALIACGGGKSSSRTKSSGNTQATSGATTSTGGAAAQPKRGGVFLSGFGNDAPHLDVHTGLWPISDFAGLFHAQLLQFQPDPSDGDAYKIVPYMAAAMPEQPDNTTYVVKLRPNIKFHNVAPVNGRAVTAQDVIWSLNRVAAIGMSQQEAASFLVRSRYNVIDKMEAIDDQTVRITTKAPSAPFLVYLADAHPSIAPQEMAKPDLKDCRIGCGPFMVADWQRDVSWDFKKNPDFFMSGYPLLDEYRYTIIKDEAARWAAFKAGQIYDDYVPVNLVQDAEGDKSVTTVHFGLFDPLVLNINSLPKFAPQNDVRVRRAIALSVNQQDLVNKLFFGRAKPSGIIPWPMGDWATPVEKLPYYKYDPAQAKQLLQAAGAEGAKITFNTTTGYAPEDNSAQLIIASLKQTGFNVDAPHYEYSIWVDHNVKGDYGAYTVWASPQVDPDGLLQSFVTTVSVAGWGTPELDAKIQKQRQTLDRNERLSLVHEIEMGIADQAWRVGLPNWYQYVSLQPFVRDNPPNTIWYANVRWAYHAWLDK